MIRASNNFGRARFCSKSSTLFLLEREWPPSENLFDVPSRISYFFDSLIDHGVPRLRPIFTEMRKNFGRIGTYWHSTNGHNGFWSLRTTAPKHSFSKAHIHVLMMNRLGNNRDFWNLSHRSTSCCWLLFHSIIKHFIVLPFALAVVKSTSKIYLSISWVIFSSSKESQLERKSTCLFHTDICCTLPPKRCSSNLLTCTIERFKSP